MAGLIVLALGGALILGLAFSGGNASPSSTAPSIQPTLPGSPACTTDQQSDPGASHVNNPTYRVTPPAGGNHFPTPAPAGLYTNGSVPTDGMLVHSLEHGYIGLWYDPTIPASDLSALEAVALQFPIDTLLVPRTGMPVPVAATAWHQRLLCQGVNAIALQNFVIQYRNKGPERIAH
jgi:hypothetical protein